MSSGLGSAASIQEGKNLRSLLGIELAWGYATYQRIQPARLLCLRQQVFDDFMQFLFRRCCFFWQRLGVGQYARQGSAIRGVAPVLEQQIQAGLTKFTQCGEQPKQQVEAIRVNLGQRRQIPDLRRQVRVMREQQHRTPYWRWTLAGDSRYPGGRARAGYNAPSGATDKAGYLFDNQVPVGSRRQFFDQRSGQFDQLGTPFIGGDVGAADQAVNEVLRDRDCLSGKLKERILADPTHQ